MFSAFEESNKFESDIDFDLKSFLKKKTNSRFQNQAGFKIEPTPIHKATEEINFSQSAIDEQSASQLFSITRTESKAIETDENTPNKTDKNLDKTIENIKFL